MSFPSFDKVKCHPFLSKQVLRLCFFSLSNRNHILNGVRGRVLQKPCLFLYVWRGVFYKYSLAGPTHTHAGQIDRRHRHARDPTPASGAAAFWHAGRPVRVGSDPRLAPADSPHTDRKPGGGGRRGGRRGRQLRHGRLLTGLASQSAHDPPSARTGGGDGGGQVGLRRPELLQPRQGGFRSAPRRPPRETPPSPGYLRVPRRRGRLTSRVRHQRRACGLQSPQAQRQSERECGLALRLPLRPCPHSPPGESGVQRPPGAFPHGLARFPVRARLERLQEQRAEGPWARGGERGVSRCPSRSAEPLCSQSTMALPAREPPLRRRSLGPVSPKRIYRNLSVRLRGGETSQGDQSQSSGRHNKDTPLYPSLWEAVENEDTLAVQEMLSQQREVNALSPQGLVPLDVAALTMSSPLLRILIRAGARENPLLCSPADWSVKLQALVRTAGRCVAELKDAVCTGPPEAQQDTQKQLRVWTLRYQLYCRMRENFARTVLPGPPSNVSLLVSSATSLTVSFREPEGTVTGLITHYRVEWSLSATFDPLCGSVLVHDTKNLHFIITGLTTGGLYFVRVSAYNVKGYGPAQSSSPPSAAPSSWTQCCGVKQRSREQAAGVGKLLEQIQDPQYRGYFIETSRVHTPSKKLSVSRSLKHLFQSATKFVRSLQRGVYLAAVFYHKDNILVTAEEQIPLVEIHSCSTSVTQDFLWFAKLSCAWKDVSWLQQAMTSSLSSSSSLLQTRQKILLAVSQLQSSLGTVDLGQVYHEPIKDRQGNVLLVTLREGSSLSPPDPLRWTPLARFQRERQRSHLLPDPTAIDTLTEHLKEKLCYHRRSVQTAQPGLYVGVLKLCSSVDQIRVLVPHKLPNLLYHARVRHNAHVSREEWAWLQGLCGRGAAEGRGPPDPGLGEFVRSLRAAVSHLLTKLNIPLHKAQCYRLYTQEVLQLGQQVSFLLLLPPSEDFCASPGKDGALSGFLTLPLQIFELVHFSAYEQEFFSQYCQASLLLELDAQLSQQALREALDRREVQEAKDRLDQVLQLTQHLDSLWRSVRWITDALHCVRHKESARGAPLGRVMEDQERGEPQSPHGSSSVPDRGSAPGSTCTDRRPSLGLDNVLWTGSRVAPDCFHPNSPVDSEGSLKSSGQSGASRRSPPARRDQSAARAYAVGQPEPRAGGCVTAGGGTDSWPGLGESGVGLLQQEAPEVGGSPSDPSVLEDSACAPSWLRLRDSAQEEEPPPWELLDSVAAPLPQDGPPGREPTLLLPRCDSRGDPLRPQPTRGRCLPERSLVEWISSPPQS